MVRELRPVIAFLMLAASEASAQGPAPATPAASVPNCEANLDLMNRYAYGTLKPQRDQYEQIVVALQARVADLEKQLADAKKTPDEKTPTAVKP